jgi:hypothetical protein
MGYYIGRTATNYFRVKDIQRFKRWAASIGYLEVLEDEQGLVALSPTDERGYWPQKDNEKTDEDEKLFGGVARHLQDGSLAVFLELREKGYARCLACVVDSKGQIIRLAVASDD